MPKARSRTPRLTPIAPNDTSDPPPDIPLFRLTILGSSRHLLNWRAVDFRKLEQAEAGAFLRAHPDTVAETLLVDPGNWYPYRNLWEGSNLGLKRFCISEDNQVTVLPWGQEPAPGSLVIASSFDLVRASHRWRPTRYVRIWNRLPGVEPVRNFPCRLTAMNRIWDRIQSLEAIAANPEQALPGAVEGPDRNGIGGQEDFRAEGEKGVANGGAKRDSCPDRNWREQEGNRMKRFHIDANNRVTVLAGEEPAAQEGSAVFHSERALRNAANGWPLARLTEIWNGLASVEPVSKFKDRATGVSRIWKQIQTLEAGAPKPTRKAKQAKEHEPASVATVTSASNTTAPATKMAQVLAMLRAPEGATLGQIMAATGWQKHSVRGFLSGAVHKKMGFTVLSFKSKDGDRTYRLKQ